MRTIKWLGSVALILLFAAGCSLNYRDEFMSQAKDKKYTEEQQLAAYYYSFRTYFALKRDDGTYGVLYSRLPKSEVTKLTVDWLKDLKTALEYQDPDWNHYLKAFSLRPYFEHQEDVWKTIHARIRAAELKQTFDDLLNGPTTSFLFGVSHDEDATKYGYDGSVFRIENPTSQFLFESNTINAAKQNGLLVPVKTFRTELHEKFSRKVPDPSFPNDENKFIWLPRNYALEVTVYKIVVDPSKVRDNFGDYLEGFRIVDGKKESCPALKAFLDGKGEFAISVLDSDLEGKVGFGLPDEVARVSENTLYSSDTVAALFPEDDVWRRVEPKKPPIQVEIARIGSAVDLWENSPDPAGWIVPTGYARGTLKDNYNVRLKFKQHDHRHDSTTVTIEHIALEWTVGNTHTPVPGQVVEYYTPNEPFKGPLVAAKVLASDSTKKLQIVTLDGDEKVGFVIPGKNIFVGTRPSRIAFTLGERRWLVWDEKGDGKYNKRREVPLTSVDKTGIYGDTDNFDSRQDHDEEEGDDY